MTSETALGQWICEACGYIYDEAEGDPRTGIAPGTRFGDVPAGSECPSCGGPTSGYTPLEPGERIDPEH
jgi:rubredoxin-NAD+ reductase